MLSSLLAGFHHGSVRIDLDTPTCFAGDTIRGRLAVHVTSPFAARSFYIRILGREHYSYAKSRRNKDKRAPRRVSDTNDFLDQLIPVYTSSRQLQCGDYAFAFEYTLPPNCPGTMKMTTPVMAEVEYSIRARVDAERSLDLTAAASFVVHQRVRQPVMPVSAEASKSFLRGGDLVLAAWTDRAVHFAGDRMAIKVQVNNTSTHGARKLIVRLVRSVDLIHRRRLTARSQCRRSLTVLHEQRYDGFEPLFFGVRILPFQLPLDVPPTSSGALIVSSNYVLEVVVDVVGALNHTTTIPLHITTPQPVSFAEPEVIHPLAMVSAAASYRPPFQPDQAVSQCNGCGIGFTLTRRRHHCRHCALIFCQSCLPHSIPIHNLGYLSPVRVCKKCFPAAAMGGTPPQRVERGRGVAFAPAKALPAPVTTGWVVSKDAREVQAGWVVSRPDVDEGGGDGDDDANRSGDLAEAECRGGGGGACAAAGGEEISRSPCVSLDVDAVPAAAAAETL